MKKLIFIFSFLLLACSVQAQVISSVKLSEDSIHIGQPMEIIYELMSPKPDLIDGIDYEVWSELESLPLSTPDTLKIKTETDWSSANSKSSSPDISGLRSRMTTDQGMYVYRDTINLTIWDIGLYTIPHPQISLADSSAEWRKLQSPNVFVSFPQDLVNPDTTTLIMPIEDIIPEKKSWRDYIWLAYLLLALLIVYLLSKFITGRKKSQILLPPDTISLPAHLIAFDRLGEIEQQKLWENDQIKQYQSDLTFAIRAYLENRFQIHALELTTDEIVTQLKKLNIESSLINELKDILQIADLVKFAKANPPKDIHSSFLQKAYSFVEKTKINMSQEEESLAREEYATYLKELAKYKSQAL